jgi:hypothetical protein
LLPQSLKLSIDTVGKAGSVLHKLGLPEQIENSDGMLNESMQLLPLSPDNLTLSNLSPHEPLANRL